MTNLESAVAVPGDSSGPEPVDAEVAGRLELSGDPSDSSAVPATGTELISPSSHFSSLFISRLSPPLFFLPHSLPTDYYTSQFSTNLVRAWRVFSAVYVIVFDGDFPYVIGTRSITQLFSAARV